MFNNEIDCFYGIDIYGNPDTKLRITMNEELVKSEIIENVISVFLIDINEMKETTIYTIMEELEEIISLPECRYMIAKWIMSKLRKAWSEENEEIEITYLLCREFSWEEEKKTKKVLGKDVLNTLFVRVSGDKFKKKN